MAGLDAQPRSRWHRAGHAGACAAGAGITELILQLRAAAGAVEGQAVARCKFLERRVVALGALALAHRRRRPIRSRTPPRCAGCAAAEPATSRGRSRSSMRSSQRPPMRARIQVARHGRVAASPGADRPTASGRTGRRSRRRGRARHAVASSGSGRRGRRTAFRGVRAAPALPPTRWRRAGLRDA